MNIYNLPVIEGLWQTISWIIGMIGLAVVLFLLFTGEDRWWKFLLLFIFIVMTVLPVYLRPG